MVNEVLQTYMRAIHRRLRHLPAAMRRRVVSEIVAHVVLESSHLQRAEPGVAPEDATRRVIDGFCPPEEIVVAYGPDGGVIRRSTGAVVLRSRVLTVPVGTAKRTVLLNGAAAAGFLAVAALVVAFAFTFVPSGDDLAVQEVSFPSIGRTLTGATGDETTTLETGAGATLLRLTGDFGSGCLGLRVTAADGTVLVDDLDGCLEGGTWDLSSAGPLQVELRYTAWTGSWSLTTL